MEKIRLATYEDIPYLLPIYDDARIFMASYGNNQQWQNGYPSEEDLTKDILKKELYVLEMDDEIVASFVMYEHEDPCYKVIYDGEWLNDEPYVVLHRVAISIRKKHLGDRIVAYAFKQGKNIRMDTHEKNIPMQRLLQRNGFVRTGTILLENGQERWAYQGIKNL